MPTTLTKHTSQFIKEKSIFVETFLNSLYVDDVNTGASSEEEILLEESYNFAKVGFSLRKFCSNSCELEKIVTQEMQEDISNENCILGLQWDKFDDRIIFVISKICTSSFDKKMFNTIETKYIRSIRISKSS